MTSRGHAVKPPPQSRANFKVQAGWLGLYPQVDIPQPLSNPIQSLGTDAGDFCSL